MRVLATLATVFMLIRGADGSVVYESYEGPQTEFHECLGRVREVMIGGAAGPGKSLALLMDFAPQWAEEDRRWRAGEIRRSSGAALHLRRTVPELDESLVRANDLFAQLDHGVHFDSQAKLFTFSCGYRYKFDGLEHEKDKYKLRSKEYSWIGLDELCSFTQTQYEYVSTRLRSTDPVLQRTLALRSSSTPEGDGVPWVRDLFIEPAPHGREILRKWVTNDNGERIPRDRLFIPATLADNKNEIYRQQYEAELQDKPPHIRDALLYGNWYVIANAFYSHAWVPALHIVDLDEMWPGGIPSHWKRFRSCDYGYTAPTCVLWWAVHPDGTLICYRELYVVRHDAEQLAWRIREIEEAAGEWGDNGSRLRGPLDSEVFYAKGQVGPTIAETMMGLGVWWDKASKGPGSRLAGARELARRLQMRVGPVGDELPGIIFGKNCRNTIRTIPSLPADEGNREEPKDGGEDHCLHGDTLVDLPTGQATLRSLVGTEGLVLSTEGRWLPYTSCRLTRRAQPTVTVTFSDGRSVRCTPDHRFLAASGEWIEARDLLNAMVYAYTPCASLSSRPRSRSSTESDSIVAASTSRNAGVGSIERSGNTTGGQSQVGTTSIIETETGPTTGFVISPACRAANISLITDEHLGPVRRSASHGPRRNAPLPLGMGARLGSLSTEELGPRHGLLSNRGPRSVAGAEDGSRTSAATEEANSVADPAERRRAETAEPTTRGEPAPAADVHSLSTDTPRLRRVLGIAVGCVAVEPSAPADVFCLMVPAAGAFSVSDGIVVSNCFDAVRYAVMTRPLKSEKDAPRRRDDDDEREDRQRRRGIRQTAAGRFGYGRW